MPFIKPSSVRVLVSHAAPIVSAGIAAALSAQPDLCVMTGALPAVAAGPASDVDVVVTDYHGGLRLLAARGAATGLSRSRPARVLLFTDAKREQQVRHALACGADGYLLQDCGIQELREAVRTVGRGQRYVGGEVARQLVDGLARQSLTAREVDVLRLLALGWPNKSIARELGISASTVKSHVQAILAKLDVATRTEAARVAEMRGYVSRGDAAPDMQQPTTGPGIHDMAAGTAAAAHLQSLAA